MEVELSVRIFRRYDWTVQSGTLGPVPLKEFFTEPECE